MTCLKCTIEPPLLLHRLEQKCTKQSLRLDDIMEYKTYKITLQNNVQNKNKVHFLKNVLYASNSVVSMV